MIVNYLLIFMVTVLFAGLAVDTGMVEVKYLQVQAAAQAASTAASLVRRENQYWTYSAVGQTAATANGFTNGVNGATVTIQNPPSSGSYSGNSSAFSAIITQAVPIRFLGVLGAGSITLTAQSVSVSGSYQLLGSAFNVNAIYTDGTSVANGGIDTAYYALSANSIGHQYNGTSNGSRLSWHGQIFYTGAPNSLNGVSNATVTLPSGSYSQLLFLATTGYGPYYNATFTVKYTDGSTTTATFNMSDWCSSSNFPGESIVIGTTYRDYYNSGPQYGFYPNIYGYTMNLDNTRSVSTLILPSCRNVVMLAMDVVP